MNIKAKDVSEINRLLKSKLDEGLKWLVYCKSMKANVGQEQLRFFASSNDAGACCDSRCTRFIHFRYKSIENVLASLGGNKQRLKNAHDKIAEAWKKHPIGLCFGEPMHEVISKLNKGELVPVNYRKNILPREAISTYHVVELSGYETKGQAHKIIKLILDAEKANKFYDEEVNSAMKDPLRKGNQLLLIGEFKSRPLQLDYDVNPIRGTGLLLKIVYETFDERQHKTELEIRTIAELNLPAIIAETAFAKYDRQCRDLVYYNHKLEQIDPSKLWSFIEAINFDNDDPVKKNASIKSEHDNSGIMKNKQTHTIKRKLF